MLGLLAMRLHIGTITRDAGVSRRHLSARKRGATALVGAACLLLLSSTIGAQRPHGPVPPPAPLVLADHCEGFEVLITYTDANQYVIRQTDAPDGTSILKISGQAKVTVTNMTTEKSLSYNISGPGTVTIFPDGRFSVNAGGPNLLWTTRENLAFFPDVPTLSYTTGRVAFEVDATGQTISYSHAGRTTDVCAALAN